MNIKFNQEKNLDGVLLYKLKYTFLHYVANSNTFFYAMTQI